MDEPRDRGDTSDGVKPRVVLRDLAEDDLDVLFDIQDDGVARQMAAFITPESGARDDYRAKWRGIIANKETLAKVIVVEGEVVGSAGAFVLDGDTEVTYWVRRDLWGRGLASAALAELLRVVTARPVRGRVAADNVGSATVLLRNGFRRVGEETAYAEARGAEIEELVYRLD
jgi:ribosomal-protein-alanine N-acetyltransferase